VYPDVGLKKARDRRDEMRKLVADGIDPSAARKHQKLMALDAAANTFEAVAREWFEKHSANWEASYSVKLLAELATEVLPQCGRHDAHRIQHPTTHAQKANLQRQPQLERRATPRLNQGTFACRESEKRLDLEAAQFARQLFES
jgi:hypothetical protein